MGTSIEKETEKRTGNSTSDAHSVRIQDAQRHGRKTVLLELKDIRKSYGAGENRVEVLRGISLAVEKGGFCVLLGPSGSGKSTLLNIIGGIDTADSGEIIIHGTASSLDRHPAGRLASMSERQLTRYRREHIGYVFQMYNLIPNLTVRENIEVGAFLSRSPLDVTGILHTLGLYDHRDKFPNQLSGGQQQRTSIGRAVVKNPDILLCDEPTGALDYNTSREILRLIERINQEYKTTIIMVTHNEAIGSMADTIIRLRDGTIRERIRNSSRIPADRLEW